LTFEELVNARILALAASKSPLAQRMPTGKPMGELLVQVVDDALEAWLVPLAWRDAENARADAVALTQHVLAGRVPPIELVKRVRDRG
jgi:hypothetical protein